MQELRAHHVCARVPAFANASCDFASRWLPDAACFLPPIEGEVPVTTASAVSFVSATPNLLVADMPASLAFYRDVLGFELVRSVPDEAPYVFVWLKRGGVELFLNDVKVVASLTVKLEAGGTSTLYVDVSDVKTLLDQLTGRAQIVMPLTDQFYGMREFAILDPDGYLLTFAQRIARE
jgi:lactoylglutathione lyase